MSFPPKHPPKKTVQSNGFADAFNESVGGTDVAEPQKGTAENNDNSGFNNAFSQALKKKDIGGGESNSVPPLQLPNTNVTPQPVATPETNVDTVNPPKAQVASTPDFNIINRSGESLLSNPGDPLGTAINDLQTKRQSIINKNIGADATAVKSNHKIIDLNGKPVSVTNGSDEVNNFDNQIQDIKQNTFANPQVADDYLKQKLNGKQVALKANNQDNLGLGHETATITPNSDLSVFDTKSLQESLDKNNVTDQLAYNRVKQQQNLNDALTSSQNLNEAALKYSANESPVIQKQIDALQKTGDKLPDAYEGQLIANFLNNPDVIQRAQSNPQLMQQYKQTASSLYTQYPEYAKRVVGQKISQAREDAGLNNPLVNVPTQGSTDKIVDDMYKAGTLNDAEKSVYENSIRPSIGVLQSIGRGIGRLIPGIQAGVDESPIVTPGFFENTENSYVNTLHGMAHSLEDISKVTPIGHVLPLPTDSDRLKQSLQNDYSTISINPKNAYNELGQSTGNMTGFVLPMIMGGTATGAIGASANASELITNGLIFEGQNRDNALKSFPDNTAKQFMYTTLATAGDMMIGKIIPAAEAKEGVNNLFKNDIKDVVNNFIDGNITESAARNTILQKATDIAGKIVKGNLNTGTAMAGFGLMHNGLDAAFGTRDVSLGDAANEAIQNFKAGFLGGTAVSAMAAFGGDQKLNGNVLLEMANNPEYYTKVINDQAKLNPELDATKVERIRNLNEAALINKDLQSVDLDNNKKGQYLIQALNENIWQRKADATTNEVLKADYIKKANESKKIQQDILSGKEISSQSNQNQNEESSGQENGQKSNVQNENGGQQNGQDVGQENDVQKEVTKKGAATVDETAPLTSFEQKAIDAVKGQNFDTEDGKKVKIWTDILQDDNSSDADKKQALKELHDQLSDPRSQIQTGVALGKSEEQVFDSQNKDTIPKRNDDFVDKYFKEGTPERQQYDKLDEAGQKKMVADKRSELANPAPEETVSPTKNSDFERQKADIEKRRQKELDAVDVHYTHIDPDTGKIATTLTEDNINKKYDAELSDLEKQNTQNKTKEGDKIQSLKAESEKVSSKEIFDTFSEADRSKIAKKAKLDEVEKASKQFGDKGEKAFAIQKDFEKIVNKLISDKKIERICP